MRFRFYKISFSDIEYLESCGRDTDIVTKDERISVHMKFSDMEKKHGIRRVCTVFQKWGKRRVRKKGYVKFYYQKNINKGT